MSEILQKRIEEAAREITNKYPFENYGDNEVVYHHLAMVDMANWTLSNQWVSVDEDLPPYDKAVIGMDYAPEFAWDDQTIIFVHRSNNPNVVTDKNKFCVYPPTFCKVTHWMEIPQIKKGVNNGKDKLHKRQGVGCVRWLNQLWDRLQP